MAALAVLFALFVVVIAAVVGADLPHEQELAVKGGAFLFFMTVVVALLVRRIFMKPRDKLQPGGPDVAPAIALDDVNSHPARSAAAESPTCW